jgi:hypothetical protein
MSTTTNNKRAGKRQLLGLVAITATIAVGAAACESDEDGMSAAACDAYVDLNNAFFGDPAGLAPAVEALAEAAPAELEDEIAVVSAAVTSDDPAASETPEYSAASQAIGDAAFEDCATEESIDVTGVDYGFGNLPTEVDAGRIAFRLSNESAANEPHELVIATGANGETAAELKELPMEELFEAARPLAVAFTNEPDTRATTMVDLEAGEYLVICTLPVGGFEAAADGPGDPHSNHGMVAILTVT